MANLFTLAFNMSVAESAAFETSLNRHVVVGITYHPL